MELLQNIWWYLVLIGVMILVHELGHYWAARYFDVKVETFSFGFGPRLFGFRRGETDFRFSLILFGGYVKMAGDVQGEETSAGDRALTAKPRWQRMIIAFAGPAINLVLAVVLLTGLFMVSYEKTPNPSSPTIGYLAPDGAAAKAGVQEGDKVVQFNDIVDPSWEDMQIKIATNGRSPMPLWVERKGERIRLTLTPGYDNQQGIGTAGWIFEVAVRIAGYNTESNVKAAEQAGLKPGDTLVSINGRVLRSAISVNEAINAAGGKPVEVVYLRDKNEYRTMVTPAKGTIEGKERWMIGVALAPTVEVVKLPFPQALTESVKKNAQFAGLIVNFLGGIVQQRVSPKSIEGPIRIAQMSGDAARQGFLSFVILMAGVSLNLAIFNLLPIPILDGGVMLILFIEMLMRRDLDLKVKETVIKVGFVFLMAVVVFVIYNDIAKIRPPV